MLPVTQSQSSGAVLTAHFSNHGALGSNPGLNVMSRLINEWNKS